MGVRANVRIISRSTGDVFLYTHWCGSELGEVLQRAMARGRGRWDDPAYLARIIFSEMTEGQEKATTGFGISSICGDGQGKVFKVNTDKQMITTPDGTKFSFESFCKDVVREDGVNRSELKWEIE